MGDSISNLTLDTVSGAYSKYSNSTTNLDGDEAASTYLDFDSYLKLLVAQMSNQDFNDPMSDNEVLQQMSSYSMLEGIKNMTNQSNITYASSLVGKAVTVNDGSEYDTGVVSSVVIENNKPMLIVNGNKYEYSKVSDIVADDIFVKMESLIGATMEATTTSDDGREIVETGKVTNVLILNGEGFVIFDNGKKYSLSEVKLKTEDTSSSDNNAENGDKTENDTAAENNTAVEAHSEQVVTPNYAAQSAALYDELMSTIDSISGRKTEKTVESVSDIIPDITGYETVTVKYLDVPDYAAAVFSEQDELLSTLSIEPDGSINSSRSSSSSSLSSDNTPLRAGNYDVKLTVDNADYIASTTRDGTISDILSNSQVKAILQNDTYKTRYSTRYGLEVQSDTRPGISISDCEPHRLYAEQYPEEAALADSLGTRMYDIRYINNTAITSRIDTSKVIGRTISGRGITEIGYSGVGRLGEVVTFEDGTQRVEIILDNGNSVWYNTSGDYTLDEICNPNAAPGSLKDLDPFEATIRYHSMKHSSADIASMASLKSQLVSYGVNVVEI